MNLDEFKKNQNTLEMELKSCPFCGGQGSFLMDSDRKNGDLSIVILYIKCNSCSANIFIQKPSKLVRSNEVEEGFYAVKEKWNNRV